MPHYLCVTCGTQFAESAQPPEHCPICEDERQYVGSDGQQWTTLEVLRTDHQMVVEPVEPGLYRLKPEPKIGIGQYAHLVQTPQGNILWDCVPFIDDATIEAINALGGVSAIAISHPHFHTVMVEWSRAFNNAPIYVHEGNRPDVVRPDPAIHYWDGATLNILDGITLVHCGGHFLGSAVLHWRDGADGRGVLLTSDTIDVVADTRYVSFMYSYPNLIPLPAGKVRRIVASVEPFAFDRLYESFGLVVDGDAKAKVNASAERYIRAITD
ncbi:MAG: MBL fold metallo-hydrolase [Anaerolineae bacterium]|nr:MBL fold metallo-hydrolase [Anaerolineae bacterium]